MFPHKNRAVLIPKTLMNEIGWSSIDITPLGAKKPSIPKIIAERDSASTKEATNTFNRQGKMRTRNDSMLGSMITKKMAMPHSPTNNDPILCHMDPTNNE